MINKFVFKTARAILVCSKCHTQVQIYGFNKFGLLKYKCVKDTCPAFGKDRNSKQREWHEYTQDYQYRKESLI